MNKIKRVFVIGHPGAGKGLFAKTLGEKLGWRIIDADIGIESKIGLPIHEILSKEAADSFFHCQTIILNNLIKEEHVVVVTDASMVCSKINREILSAEFSVFLDTSTSVQLERNIRRAAPLLPFITTKELFDNLHDERDELNKLVSTLTIDGNKHALDEHIQVVMNAMRESFNVDVLSDDGNAITREKSDSIFFHNTRHSPVQLSTQQATCLTLLAQGKSSKLIARDMSLSHRTVEGIIAQTKELLGCKSSKELMALYFK